MNEYLTGDDLAAAIILLRDSDERAILLMEGASDCGLFDPHLEATEALTLPGHGKVNVVRAMEILKNLNSGLVVAVLDADWAGADLQGVVGPPFFFTQLYDIDMDLFALPGVVERVMSNLCSGKVIVQGQGTSLSEAKRTVIRLAFVPGVLRYLSHREGYELALRDLPLGAVVDMQSVDVDIEKLVNIARAKSRSPVAGAERLLIDLHECLSTPLYDEIRYCSGHDVCAIWALLFREEYGITIGSAQLERILRSAIGCYEFQQLTVVRQLGEWGQRVGVKLWDCAA